jgi:hypothetical protein
MGISKVLLFRQVIIITPLIHYAKWEIIRFAQFLPCLPSTNKEIRDIIENIATLPPRLLNAESGEKESLQAAAFEYASLCSCKVGKSYTVKTVW